MREKYLILINKVKSILSLKRYVLISSVFILTRQISALFFDDEFDYIYNKVFNHFTFFIFVVVYLFLFEGIFAPIYNLKLLFNKKVNFNKFQIIMIILNILIIFRALVINLIMLFFLVYLP